MEIQKINDEGTCDTLTQVARVLAPKTNLSLLFLLPTVGLQCTLYLGFTFSTYVFFFFSFLCLFWTLIPRVSHSVKFYCFLVSWFCRVFLEDPQWQEGCNNEVLFHLLKAFWIFWKAKILLRFISFFLWKCNF